MFSILLALPFIGALYYFVFPPQCPPEYTQQQVDASRCIVGANIGGVPLFIAGIVIILLVSHWTLKKTIGK